MEHLCRTSREVPCAAGTAILWFGEDGPGRVRLVGELDLSSVGEVEARLVAMEGDLELDCSGLTFIDASGIRVFVAVYDACVRRGARLVIVNPSRCVVRLLELTGVGGLLGVSAERSVR
jgi:anti-sigma B factor antagonist